MMDADDRAAQLYTLEYQKAAERYENIYRSMWTIFSYLTAVTAGLLAFGSDRIDPNALVFIAAIPLLFWFWTTYLPLDYYGNRVVNHLGEIERLLNARFQTELKQFTTFAHPLTVFKGNIVHRARPRILFFFILLHCIVIYKAFEFRQSGKPLFREKPAAAAAVTPRQDVTVVGSSK